MPKGISETAFLSQVADILNLYQWRWCHIRPGWSERGYRTPIQGNDPDGFKGKGLPDIIAVRPPRLLFAELKKETGNLEPAQEAWFEDLNECVKQISLEPIERKGKPIADGWAGIEHLIPSFEVYLWRPDDIEKIVEILK